MFRVIELLCSRRVPQVAVLAFNEVVSEVTVEAVALVGMNG